jgi:predicted esterase
MRDPLDESLEKDLTLKAEIDLYYDLFVPPGITHPAPLLISAHGYGAHKRYMMREGRAIAPTDFVIVSIQGPHQHFRRTDDGYRVGFGWLTDHKSEEYIRLHHEFVLRIIDKYAGEGLIDGAKVYLFGFSQACALNFRFAFTYPDVLTGIVGVCGGIPGDLDSNQNYNEFSARTFYLFGDDDEFYTQEQFADFDAKLRSRLPNYTSKHYTAKHQITDDMRTDVRQFLGFGRLG